MASGRQWIGRHGLAASAVLGLGALLWVLRGGPTSGQIGAGVLTTSGGAAVTVSRASSKTCATGATQDLAQLLPNPEKLDQSTGGISSITVTADTTVAPDGTMTADTVTATGASPVFASSPGPTTQAVTYSGSMYLRSASPVSMTFSVNDSLGAVLCTQAVTTTTSWQRVSCSGADAAGRTNWVKLSGFNSGDVFQGWGMKLEVSASPTAYTFNSYNNQALVTLGSNTPCVEPNGLSVEGAATNLVLQSSDWTNVAWAKSGATPTAAAAIAPDGTLTAQQLAFSITGNYTLSSSTPVTDSSTYTASVWMRAVSGTQSNVRLNLRGQNGNTITNTVTPTLTTAWQRVQVSGAPTAGNTPAVILIDSTGGAQSVMVWGAQLENSSFATSYIPTTGTSATRASETYNLPNVALTNTSGCVAVCIVPGWSSNTPSSAGLNSVVGSAGGQNFLYSNFTDANIGSFDGTNYIGVSAQWAAGVKQCYRTEWGAGARVLTNVTSGASSTSATGWTTAFSTATLQGNMTGPGSAWLSNIVAGSGPGKCQ